MRFKSFAIISNIRIVLLGVAVCCCFFSNQAFGDEFERQSPTIYLVANGGFATYKSELMDSNDTSLATQYGFGVTGGIDHDISIFIKSDSMKTAFKLNESSLSAIWNDTLLRYRFGPVYAGLAIASNEFTAVTAADNKYLDGRGNGYGGNFGLMIPFYKNDTLYLDVLSTSSSKVIELSGKTFAIGSRMDIDLGANFGLTKRALDFICGYRYRTYSLTLDGASGKELVTSTYLGLRMGYSF